MAEYEEDFFQRIKDVSWDIEPPCYYVIGDTVPGFDSFGGGSIWTSPDGISWHKAHTNLDSDGVTSAQLVSGMWMRQGFRLETKPVWLLGGMGTADPPQNPRTPLIISSHDGCEHIQHTYFPPIDQRRTVKDIEPQPDNLTPNLARGGIYFISSLQEESHTTSIDGLEWTDSIATRGSATSGEIPPPIKVAGQEMTAGGKDPSIRDSNQIWRVSGTSAHGTVRKGPLQGHKLSLNAVKKEFDSHGYYHTSYTVTDHITGEKLGGSNPGIPFIRGLSYGHYKFVAVGNSAISSEDFFGCVSYSEDGLTWKLQKLSFSILWAIVIGPRV